MLSLVISLSTHLLLFTASCLLHYCSWNAYIEFTPLSQFTLHPYPSIMLLNDSFDNSQACTCSTSILLPCMQTLSPILLCSTSSRSRLKFSERTPISSRLSISNLLLLIANLESRIADLKNLGSSGFFVESNDYF